MAEPHVGKRVVITMDLEGFFPQLTFGRVLSFLLATGFRPEVADLLAHLLTGAAPPTAEAIAAEAPQHRHATAGSPTSGALGNLLLRGVDYQLAARLRRIGFGFGRYSDDLACSGNDVNAADAALRIMDTTLRAAGYTPKERKTRVMFHWGHQEVTGMTVNQVLGKSKAWRQELASEWHVLKLLWLATGDAGAVTVGRLDGRMSYLHSVNPEQAARIGAALWWTGLRRPWIPADGPTSVLTDRGLVRIAPLESPTQKRLPAVLPQLSREEERLPGLKFSFGFAA